MSRKTIPLSKRLKKNSKKSKSKNYATFITEISKDSGLPEEDVRLLFDSLPKVLMRLEDNEYVMTPIGSFKMRVMPSRTYCFVLEEGEHRGVCPAYAYLDFKAKKAMRRAEKVKPEKALTEEDRLIRKGIK